MKPAKRKITISYEIISQNCHKAIVKGCKTFFEDSHSVTFLKRLVKVKNNLCARTDNDKFTKVIKEQKKDNAICRKYNITDVRNIFNEDGLPYVLKYSCSTTY